MEHSQNNLFYDTNTASQYYTVPTLNLYNILKIKRDAVEEEIRQGYIEALKDILPLVYGVDFPENNTTTSYYHILFAKDVLTTKRKRSAYDILLNNCPESDLENAKKDFVRAVDDARYYMRPIEKCRVSLVESTNVCNDLDKKHNITDLKEKSGSH